MLGNVVLILITEEGNSMFSADTFSEVRQAPQRTHCRTRDENRMTNLQLGEYQTVLLLIIICAIQATTGMSVCLLDGSPALGTRKIALIGPVTPLVALCILSCITHPVSCAHIRVWRFFGESEGTFCYHEQRKMRAMPEQPATLQADIQTTTAYDCRHFTYNS